MNEGMDRRNAYKQHGNQSQDRTKQGEKEREEWFIRDPGALTCVFKNDYFSLQQRNALSWITQEVLYRGFCNPDAVPQQ